MNQLLWSSCCISLFLLHWILGMCICISLNIFNFQVNFLWFFRLTITTELYISHDMKLVDTNGYSHELTPHQVRVMMTIGWLAFFFSCIMNISFYAVHPSMVDLSLMKLKRKCSIHIYGRKVSIFDKQGKSNIFLKKCNKLPPRVWNSYH